MNLRLKMAVLGAPLVLRILLAVVFLWAGLGKLMESTPVEGEKAALLANMGAIQGPSAAEPTPPPTTPVEGEQPPPAPPSPAEARPAGGYTADDFPRPVQVRRVLGLALVIHSAANPAPREDGSPTRRLWPSAVAGGSSPVVLAWLVALTEAGGGLFILLGLLTRFWAASLMGVMLGAIWLTEIGPAVQSGKTGFLGLLPDHPTFDTKAWQPLLFQFSLFMAAFALLLAGPGLAALDNAIFRRRGGDDD